MKESGHGETAAEARATAEAIWGGGQSHACLGCDRDGAEGGHGACGGLRLCLVCGRRPGAEVAMASDGEEAKESGRDETSPCAEVGGGDVVNRRSRATLISSLTQSRQDQIPSPNPSLSRCQSRKNLKTRIQPRAQLVFAP